MSIELELQIASAITTLPHPSQFREWVAAALEGHLEDAEMTIRLVDELESAQLNQQFRKKTGPTNVISFPYDPSFDGESSLLGDIVVCAPLVEKEATHLNKPLLARWAHMVIHGTLHLLGYNHENPAEAEIMEGLETDLLIHLGFPPPYGDTFLL